MSSTILSETLDLVTGIAAETRQIKVKVTFHGGEPLSAGLVYWRQALSGLNERFGARGSEIALQSNLWLLDEELCGLFHEHRVRIGTSLDGPEKITDAQRGTGYFARTMQGVRRAQALGMTVGCIATFTPANLTCWREVFDFFLDERIRFSIHPALPTLDENSPQVLTPAQYGRLLIEMLNYYIEHRRELSVLSLDQMCHAVASGEGEVCTFRDCLGMFLVVDPTGDIYSCQRFCGRPAWRLGTLSDRPTLEQLLSSPVAKSFRQREDQVRRVCNGCAHWEYCRGGCPYNAWSGGTNGRTRDPYCDAYREVLDSIRQRLLAEMQSESNIEAVAARPWDGRRHPLLRKGPLIELAREGQHPSQLALTARRIVAAVELARGPDIPAAAARLVGMGICRTRQSAKESLHALQQRLHPKSVTLNNLYLHVTFGCQQHCTHCYARAGGESKESEMPVTAIEGLILQAKNARFRQVVITGGEPLIHSHRDEMLDSFAALRRRAFLTNLVLRTNFALPFNDDDLLRIAAAFYQIVASVDGDRETHDARRGAGAYDRIVGNLERYQALYGKGFQPAHAANMPAAELSLACVMRAGEIQGKPGCAVLELAKRLNIRRTRFRPLLPLGRAQDWPEPPASEALGADCDPMELIENGFHPVSGCGLGQNLYVGPSGESFPCYAYHEPHSFLGNVIGRGLQAILDSPSFCDLACHTVDTNPKCQQCEVRYLCGGACRAWGGESAQHDLDASPTECAELQTRAMRLLATAQSLLKTK